MTLRTVPTDLHLKIVKNESYELALSANGCDTMQLYRVTEVGRSVFDSKYVMAESATHAINQAFYHLPFSEDQPAVNVTRLPLRIQGWSANEF